MGISIIWYVLILIIYWFGKDVTAMFKPTAMYTRILMLFHHLITLCLYLNCIWLAIIYSANINNYQSTVFILALNSFSRNSLISGTTYGWSFNTITDSIASINIIEFNSITVSYSLFQIGQLNYGNSNGFIDNSNDNDLFVGLSIGLIIVVILMVVFVIYVVCRRQHW